MKKNFEHIKGGILFGISAILTIIIFSAIAFAAGTWSTTSPTTITGDTALYSDSGNTLTAAKWNELVNSNKWKTAPNDSSDFNINCERRMITTSASNLTFNADYVGPGQVLTYNNAGGYRHVLKANKTVFAAGTSAYTLLRLEYRCP